MVILEPDKLQSIEVIILEVKKTGKHQPNLLVRLREPEVAGAEEKPKEQL